MSVMKVKSQFSNKTAPSKDIARKMMKTEDVRHICSGGRMVNGAECATQLVLAEAQSCQSFMFFLELMCHHAVRVK